MDPRGSICTIYPLALAGADVEPGYDPNEFAPVFTQAMLDRLRKAGVQARPATPGMPDQGYVVTLQLVKLRKGNPLNSIFFAFGMLGGLLSTLAGPHSFQVTGAIGSAQAPFAALNGAGKHVIVAPFGRNAGGISSAAKMAGKLIGNQIVKEIKKH